MSEQRASTSEGWVTRRVASERLGIKLRRLDMLRQLGVLASERDPVTRAVRISSASLEAELRRRSGA